MKNKILLAYSGGLDTSAIIPWLKDRGDCEVIAYCSNLGNAPDVARIEQNAYRLGASQFIFENLEDRFVEDFVFPLVRAGGIYQNQYLLGTAIARPLIAERIAHFARELGATSIAHGATGKGNDQIRFERAWATLVPDLEVIAPWKTWDFHGRNDLIRYLESKGHPFEGVEKRFSVDVNLYHRSCEGGILESIQNAYQPEEVFEWISPPTGLHSGSEHVEITWNQGYPTHLNERALGAADLLKALNTLASRHGIGVVDLVEERANGIKSRGIYETPGGTLLHFSIQSLKHLNWDRALNQTATQLGQRYGELVYDGLWHSPLRESIDAFFGSASTTLTGKIGLRLQNGQIFITKRESPFSLYSRDGVSFEDDIHGINHASIGWSRTLCYSSQQIGRQLGRRQQIQLRPQPRSTR